MRRQTTILQNILIKIVHKLSCHHDFMIILSVFHLNCNDEFSLTLKAVTGNVKLKLLLSKRIIFQAAIDTA
jgi:hypothetical protein